MIGIRARRIATGLTQMDVAELIGVKQAAVSKWESGETFPRMDKLKELAGLYECTVDELIDEVEEGVA